MNCIDYFLIVTSLQREIQFARACMVQHVPCSIRSICFTCLTDIVVKWMKTLQNLLKFFLQCSIFSMPRIPNNLRKRVIGMLDADFSIEHIVRHVGCSSRAIWNLRIRLRMTGSTNDLPHKFLFWFSTDVSVQHSFVYTRSSTIFSGLIHQGVKQNMKVFTKCLKNQWHTKAIKQNIKVFRTWLINQCWKVIPNVWMALSPASYNF